MYCFRNDNDNDGATKHKNHAANVSKKEVGGKTHSDEVTTTIRTTVLAGDDRSSDKKNLQCKQFCQRNLDIVVSIVVNYHHLYNVLYDPVFSVAVGLQTFVVVRVV